MTEFTHDTINYVGHYSDMLTVIPLADRTLYTFGAGRVAGTIVVSKDNGAMIYGSVFPVSTEHSYVADSPLGIRKLLERHIPA